MSALISYALICPEAEIASGEAVMVTAPGSEGEFWHSRLSCAFCYFAARGLRDYRR